VTDIAGSTVLTLPNVTDIAGSMLLTLPT